MDSELVPRRKTQEDKRPRDPERWIRRPVEKYRKRKITPPLQPGAEFFITFTGREVPIHIFDTFEGHPAAAITSHDEHHTVGQFGGTDVDTVRTLLAPFTKLTIHKGDVSGSLPHLAESTYRLVHIDTDLYQPTIVCLDYFGDRLCRGGAIVVDDYGAPKCAGVATAVSEYLAQTDDFHVWDMRTDQLVLVRR
jgi:hypothetical protein